jgi:hypothetical protein
MAKVDKDYVKTVFERLQMAKDANHKAQEALQKTPEYRIAQDARHGLDQAEDCLMGLQTILNAKVI